MAITKFDDDYRARRITAYLDFVDQIVKEKFESVKNSCFEIGSEITKYFEMLAETSPLKALYQPDPAVWRRRQGAQHSQTYLSARYVLTSRKGVSKKNRCQLLSGRELRR